MSHVSSTSLFLGSQRALYLQQQITTKNQDRIKLNKQERKGKEHSMIREQRAYKTPGTDGGAV